MEIYIHIPFCVQKCKYCDFLSSPADKSVQDTYMQALCTELSYRSDEYKDRCIETIFIGGGTPSIVEAEWIIKIMDILFTKYGRLKTAMKLWLSESCRDFLSMPSESYAA